MKMSNKFQNTILCLALWALLSPMIVMAGTTQEPVVNQLDTRITLSGKSPRIVVNQEKFAEQLFATSTIELGYTPEPVNNLYVFFDPMCTGCQGIKSQLTLQSKLYSDYKVNVKIIPVGASKEGRMKAVHLYVDNADFLDKSVRDLKIMVDRNTQLYAKSFDSIGTPLIVWQTDKGLETLKGFPSQKTNSSFLKTVAKKKGIANWIMELSEVEK